ncbi:MAG TPA: hypothetical protein VF950_03810 [Planctomycetota bacterium]
MSKAPQYLAETRAAVARLEESTTPEQYAALRARAERLVGGLFTVEILLEDEIQAEIALREKFEPARVKQAILNVATWRLIESLAGKWSGTPAAPVVRARAVMA